MHDCPWPHMHKVKLSSPSLQLTSTLLPRASTNRNSFQTQSPVYLEKVCIQNHRKQVPPGMQCSSQTSTALPRLGRASWSYETLKFKDMCDLLQTL